MPLDFVGQEFSMAGRRILVWFGLWENDLVPVDVREAPDDRWRRAWEGRRVLSRQSLELILSGTDFWEVAETLLREWVALSVSSGSRDLP